MFSSGVAPAVPVITKLRDTFCLLDEPFKASIAAFVCVDHHLFWVHQHLFSVDPEIAAVSSTVRNSAKQCIHSCYAIATILIFQHFGAMARDIESYASTIQRMDAVQVELLVVPLWCRLSVE